MNHINVKRFGFASGTTLALLYTGCIVVLSFTTVETTIAFLNNLMHGLDLSSIVRKTTIPIGEALIGVAEWFIIGWLVGASIAVLYNATSKNKT
ncbi:MAG: DUF5676 family membrane protein [Saprospiraceae bacterium]